MFVYDPKRTFAATRQQAEVIALAERRWGDHGSRIFQSVIPVIHSFANSPRELATNSILAGTRRTGKSMAFKLAAASQLFITH
jgi:hypothetical protein